ncbi:putative L-PSP endoribonuclease family protein, partial [Aureobasidium melanogenum]
MSSKTAVLTSKAPKPLPGIYSQAIVANGFVYCSGAIAMDTTGKIIDGDIQAHTHQCIKNLTAVLEEAGTTIEKVIKVNVFLSDMDDFAKMNEVYKTYWGDVKPSRTCVAVKTLPLGTDVEIDRFALALVSDADREMNNPTESSNKKKRANPQASDAADEAVEGGSGDGAAVASSNGASSASSSNFRNVSACNR